MDRNPIDALALRQVDHRAQVAVYSVDAARADQSHQVQRSTVLPDLAACTHQCRIGVEAAVGDGRGDTYEILHHYSSGAEIEVSDFAVPHLPRRQADAKPGSFEQRPRSATPERVPGGRVGECDCVAVSFGAIAPSVEYDERDW